MPELTEPMKTAQAEAIIRDNLIPSNPGRRFAYSQKTASIGVWNPTLNKFQVCVSYAITGEWVFVEFECLVNGKRIEHEWLDVGALEHGKCITATSAAGEGA
jgi:hypothetical protein